MTKRFLFLFSLFLAVLFISVSCETNTQPTEKTAINPSKVLVEAIPYSEVQPYVDSIMELDEYRNNLPNQAKTTHIFSFDVRKLIINDSVYYHLELWKTRIARMEESTIPSPEILAYFRILPRKGQVLIMDKSTKQFIPLMNRKGKACLDNYMH